MWLILGNLLQCTAHTCRSSQLTLAQITLVVAHYWQFARLTLVVTHNWPFAWLTLGVAHTWQLARLTLAMANTWDGSRVTVHTWHGSHWAYRTLGVSHG